MEANLSEEQRNFRQMAIEFSRRELNDGAKEREKRGEFFEAGWQKCAEFGILGITLPEKYGGMGLDTMTCIATMEGLGYACRDSGLLFAINSHIWTCEAPINKFGSDAQKRNYLPRLIAGTIKGGHAMTEPGSGSDAFSMRCKAERSKNGYLLNGSKTFITNAPIADILLVFAVTDKSKGFAGISAFIVEKGFPGFSVGSPLDMMGLKTCPLGEVFLQDCEVPEENRLGLEGAGSAIFNSEMEWERSCLFAAHLGAMEHNLEACIKYAKERTTFGVNIGSHQAVAFMLADMAKDVEAARLLVYQAAQLADQGHLSTTEAICAKAFAQDMVMRTACDAVQIFGGYGYTKDFPVEKYYRDSKLCTIGEGTSEIQKLVISRDILRD